MLLFIVSVTWAVSLSSQVNNVCCIPSVASWCGAHSVYKIAEGGEGRAHRLGWQGGPGKRIGGTLGPDKGVADPLTPVWGSKGELPHLICNISEWDGEFLNRPIPVYIQ